MDIDKLRWIFSVPFGITISLIGIIGNLISICVWRRIMKSKRHGAIATTIYLIVLGIVDTALLFFFLLTNTIPGNNPDVKETFSYAAFYSYFGFPVYYFLIVVSIWMMAGVTITRFIMIVYPIQGKIWCSSARAFIGIASIIVTAFLINVPHFFFYRPIKLGSDGYELQKSKFGKSSPAKIYEFWIHCIFLTLGPWLIVVVLNAIIIKSLIKQTKVILKRENTSSMKPDRNRHDRQMTTVLLAVSFTFLILYFPKCILSCVIMIGGPGQHDAEFAFAIAKNGIILNSASNWFLYCVTGSVFRRHCKAMFGCQNRNRFSSSLSTSFSMSTKSMSMSRVNTLETLAESKY